MAESGAALGRDAGGSVADGPAVRFISDPDLPAWSDALSRGFLVPAQAEQADFRRRYVDPARTIGAFDGGACVGTLRGMRRQLTVADGAGIAAACITNVTVSVTHRRRGLLRGMLRLALDQARDLSEAVSILVSSAYPIYRRFGYGPATHSVDFDIDTRRGGVPDLRRPGRGSIAYATAQEVRRHGPVLHERFRRRQPGAIDRDDLWWGLATGEVRRPWETEVEPVHALHRDRSGSIDGLVSYRLEERWDRKLPEARLDVHDLIATTPQAESALWCHVLAHDWVSEVRAPYRAPDDVVPLLLEDPRAARVVGYGDFLWLRFLDVAKALSAREYPAEGRLVLDLRDPGGYASGRFLLDAGPAGAACAPTTANPDLRLDVATLAAIYLGDESASRIAALRGIDEETPGALARTDLLFRTPRRPWCPDIF